MKFIVLFLTVSSLISCSSSTVKHIELSKVAQQYFVIYDQRSNFELFMSFYADHAQLTDMVYGNQLNNKTEIADFLNWQRGNFQTKNQGDILTITNQIVSNNTVITEGYFHTFSYDNQNLGPWYFIISQEFDDNNKIIKQIDWINYTPRKNYLGGANINQQLGKQ